MDPKFIIAVDEFQYDGVVYPTLDHLPEIVENVPSIEKVILVVSNKETRKKDLSNIRHCVFLEEFLTEGRTPDGEVPDMVFEQLSFDHPLYIHFTSGTTGSPKAVVHSAGSLLSLLRTNFLSLGLKCGSVFCVDIQVGCPVWDVTVPCLAQGASILMKSSSPLGYHDYKNFWDIMDEYNVSLVFMRPNAMDKMETMGIVPSHDINLDCLKMIATIGTPANANNFEFIRNNVKKDLYIFNYYGTTEIFGDLSGFDFNLPVQVGEIQIPSLGMDIQCFDSEGKSIIGQRGELVLCTPAFNFPLGLWKDRDNKRLNRTYFSKFPGAWSLHDYGWFNPKTNGFTVIGRSFNTLKQCGDGSFLSEDIYFAIHSLKELQDYICVSQRRDDGDSRVILFVKMQEGLNLTPEIKDTIERKVVEELRDECVPHLIVEVPDIPYNMNEKRTESVVTEIVETNQIPEDVNIKNPESLKHFLDIPEVLNYKNH